MRTWIVLVVVAVGSLTGLMLMPVDPRVGRAASITAADRLADALSGDGTVLHMLAGLIVYGGFAFVLQLREVDEARGMLFQRLLRHGSAPAWARVRVARIMRSAAVYLTVVAALGIAAGVLTGSTQPFPAPHRLQLLLTHYVLCGTLQLLAYGLAVLIVGWAAPGAAGGLITVAVVVAGGVLQIETSTWLPVQLADMAVTRGGWEDVEQAVLTLTVAVSLLALALAVLVRTTRPA